MVTPMDNATKNAIRNLAKQANEEIKVRRKKEPHANVDKICVDVLKDKFKKVEALGVNRLWLSYYLGVVNGTLIER